MNGFTCAAVVCLGIICFVVGVGTLCVVGLNVVSRVGCEAQAEAMHVKWSYGLNQGCMIAIDGQTIPLDAYKLLAAYKVVKR